MAKLNKDVERVVKEALARGWFLDRIGKHFVYKHPEGGCVTVSKSPSDVKAWRKIEKDFINEEIKHSSKG